MTAEGGAEFFYVGTDNASKSDALVNSPERQRAYKTGDYIPKIYIMIWDRQALISWAMERAT